MKSIYILTIPLFIACGTAKKVEHNNKDVNVVEDEEIIEISDTSHKAPYNTKITISHFTPYCGGAAPDDEMLARQTSLQSNTIFILINHSTGEKTNVKTDSEGVLYLNLAEGAYAIRETYKNCSYEEFYEKHYQPNSDYHQTSTDQDCYKNWWASNLGEIHITKSDSLNKYEYMTSSACFVGRNPCVNYTGPWPP